MAETVAEARPWKQRPHTLGGAVKAIRQDASDPIGRVLLGCGALEHAIGLGKGCGTGLRGIAEMPEHAATDNRGPIDLVSETAAVLLVGQEIERQWAAYTA